MKYLIYKITNTINGKIYVGAHQTMDECDSYMGSGKLIRAAQRKYGIENFTKETLHVLSSKEEMYAMERMIVDESFVSQPCTYNIKVGGEGGWDHTWKCPKRIAASRDGIIRAHKEGTAKFGWAAVNAKKDKATLSRIAALGGMAGGGSNRHDRNAINERFAQIQHVDLTKFGWVGEVARVWNVSHTQARRYIEKYYDGEVYKRK